MAGFMKLQVWLDNESGGYMARYSAPGYMDCTEDNGPFPTADEAIAETFELYGDKGDCDDEPTADEHEAIEALIYYGISPLVAAHRILGDDYPIPATYAEMNVTR